MPWDYVQEDYQMMHLMCCEIAVLSLMMMLYYLQQQQQQTKKMEQCSIAAAEIDVKKRTGRNTLVHDVMMMVMGVVSGEGICCLDGFFERLRSFLLYYKKMRRRTRRRKSIER